MIVRALRQYHRLDHLLRAAQLARSTFYYQCQVLQQPNKNAAISDRIKTLYWHHRGRYGYRRIQTALVNEGYVVNHKRIWRLMQCLGLQGRHVPRKRYNCGNGPYDRLVPNRLKQDFETDQPLTKLATDISEIYSKPDGRKLYISPIIDLFNGEVINLTLRTRADTQLLTDMLKHPRLKQVSRTCICHSDQGLQYRHKPYHRALARLHIQPSMSRRGNCYDNACIESFFGILKRELGKQLESKSIASMKQAIRRYVHYYNHERIKLRLKTSPVAYRLQYGRTM